MYEPKPPIHHNGPTNAMYEKLEDNQRKKIDEAIIKRDPHTLKAIHEKFKLAEKGISYQSLHGYAREIRDQANKLTLMESTFSSEIDLVEHLKNQLGRQCLDMILNADANGMSPLDAQRIANAFGKCLQYNLTIARTKALEAATARADVAARLVESPPETRAPAGRGSDVAADVPVGRGTRATARPARQELEVGDDPEARYGRHEDGTPRTHEQYCATVNKVMFEVFAPKSVKEAAAREAAAREAAEKAAAAKQTPDHPPSDSADGASHTKHRSLGGQSDLELRDSGRSREVNATHISVREK
jgi:hypothetical protein